MWLALEDGSYLNLALVCRAWESAGGAMMVRFGGEGEHTVRLRERDAAALRKALRLEAKQTADRLDSHS